MPLQFAVSDDGHVGEALRSHRGSHKLLGTGPCRRLAKLLPSKVTDNGTAAEVDFDLAEWLGSPLLVPVQDAMDAHIYRYVHGREKMGSVLDHALNFISDDHPRPPSVLRAQLRSAALEERQKTGDMPVYRLAEADLYEVATAFPSGARITDVYDWMPHLTFGGLLAADGTNAVYGVLSKALGTRFEPDALEADGPVARFAKAVEASVDKEDAPVYGELEAAELAAELSRWLVGVLPLPDELIELAETTPSALLQLRRVLRGSRTSTLIPKLALSVLLAGPPRGPNRGMVHRARTTA